MEQMDAVIAVYGWRDSKSNAAVVAAAMMMWYYHYPVEKVRLCTNDSPKLEESSDFELSDRCGAERVAVCILTAEELITRSSFVNQDLRKYASTVSSSTTYKDCTSGTLTPARRFVEDKSVPAVTR
jgi:hypothetical protein